MREVLLVVFTVIGSGLVAVGLLALAVSWLDEWTARGWSLSEGVAPSASPRVAPSLSVPAAQASSLCDGCGQLHQPETLPLELLLAGGVDVSAAHWFGGRLG